MRRAHDSPAFPAFALDATTRLVRTWHGFEGYVPDYLPLAGELHGAANAFVIGCTRGGYTIGPYVGTLVAEHILGKTTELPLFDPNRFQTSAGASRRVPSGSR